ncbi:MAG: nucleotide disphospho-sugar-binding domain-containing protein [Myxococcota bacterium]
MKRAMVFTIPERGHYHPLLGPALELERRGFEVVWGTPADIRSELRAAGVKQVALPPDAPPPDAALRGKALTELLTDPAALAGWIRAMLIDAQAELVEPFREMIRRVKPGVVAIDSMVYAAAIAAEREGVPWVGWSTSLNPVVPDTTRSTLIETLEALDPMRHALFERHGLEARFRVSDVLSPHGTAVFTTSAVASAPADPTIRLVGPSRGGDRTGVRPEIPDRGSRRLAYASFGSQAWYQPERFERIIAAATRRGLAMIASMGDLDAEFRARGLPPTIRCEADVDQLAVLEQADVIVTHGGANSVMESLAAGVPLLLAPICNDQPHNLAMVEHCGAGQGIDLETASVELIGEALARLAGPGPHRDASQRIADSYRAQDGSRGAADLAEEAMR